MKAKKSTIDEVEMNNQWCPLFGALPTCREWNGVTEKCLQIIEEARSFWGSFEYLKEIKSPAPERIEKNTGHSAAWIKSARLLTMGCATNDILFNARHQQGIISQGAGWINGMGGDYFLSTDVDQLAVWSIFNTIKQRAGIAHDFTRAMVGPDQDRYYEDDGKPSIAPAMIYALLAIGIAWHLAEDIARGTVGVKSQEAASELLKAEKLLKAAIADALDRKIKKELWAETKAKIDGSKGYSSGMKKHHDLAHTKHEMWQHEANLILARRPKLSKTKIAEMICEKTGDELTTVRKKIVKA